MEVGIRFEVSGTQKSDLYKLFVCMYDVVVVWPQGYCKRFWTDFDKIFRKPVL